MRLGLLCGFHLRRLGHGLELQEHAQRLVALLALQYQPVHRVYVAGVLWPEVSDKRAAASLRTTLWRLGRVAEDLIDVAGPTLALAPAVEVDVRFASERAHTLIERPHDYCPHDVELLGAQGELLPDWYDDWVLFERERFRDLRLHALESLTRALTAVGAYAEAAEAGLAAVMCEPLRESAHRAVVATYLAEGNKAEALRHYELFRRHLHGAVGLHPSERMEMLIASLDRSS